MKRALAPLERQATREQEGVHTLFNSFLLEQATKRLYARANIASSGPASEERIFKRPRDASGAISVFKPALSIL